MIIKEPYIGMPIYLDQYDKRPSQKPMEPNMPPTMPDDRPANNQSRPENHPMGPHTEHGSMGTAGPVVNPERAHADAGIVVGMAYVPWQEWSTPYDVSEAFDAGTIFPDLNLPFKGYQGGMKK